MGCSFGLLYVHNFVIVTAVLYFDILMYQ